MDGPIKSLVLPERKEHEIVLIELPNGQVVARTRAELDAAQKQEKKP